MNKKIVGFFLVGLVWAPFLAWGDMRCRTALEPHYDVLICLDPSRCDFERVFLDPNSMNSVEKIWLLNYPESKISASLFWAVRRLSELGATVTGTDSDQYTIRTQLGHRSAVALFSDKILGPMISEVHGSLKHASEEVTGLIPFRFSISREVSTYTFPGTKPEGKLLPKP